MLAVLAMLCAVAGAVVWRARRRGVTFLSQGGRKRLRVIERLALSRRATLLVVEYEGSRLLLAQSGDQLSLLSSGPVLTAGNKDHAAD